MKIKKKSLCLFAGFLFLALAGMMGTPCLRAQSAAASSQNRVLLIFDTSSAMKKRLPAEVTGLKRLIALGLSAQMQTGDSIGVWTFDQNLRTGEFPLQEWQFDNITLISSNIIDFLQAHRYSKTTSFDKLMPVLDGVMNYSPRLTTVIFCDGEAHISGTPVDDSINGIFEKNEIAMRKAHEPYVIVFRTEFGRYIGSTINTAESINLPPMPPPPAPPTAPVAPPPPPQPIAPPPLIIIGTKVGTNLPPANPPVAAPQPAPPQPAPITPAPAPPVATPPPASPAPAPSPVPQAITAPETNFAPPVAVTPPPVSAPVAAPVSVNPSPAPSPPVAVAMNNPAVSAQKLMLIGIGLLVVAGVGIFLVIRRARRRDAPSLITESLKK